MHFSASEIANVYASVLKYAIDLFEKRRGFELSRAIASVSKSLMALVHEYHLTFLDRFIIMLFCYITSSTEVNGGTYL